MRLWESVRCLTAMIVICFALPVLAEEATAKATMTIGGEEIVMKHALVEDGMREETMLLVTDRALPEPCSVTEAMLLASSGGFSGVAIGVNPDLTMAPMPAAIFHSSLQDNEGWMSVEGAIEAESRGSMIEGTMSGTAMLTEDEVPVRVTFSIPTEVNALPIVARTVSGDGSAPSKGFAAMTAAVLKGDLDAFLETVSSEMREMIVADDPGPEVLREVADFMLPHHVEIRSTSLEGDAATLEGIGSNTFCGNVNEGPITIQMVKEKGAWRVASVESMM